MPATTVLSSIVAALRCGRRTCICEFPPRGGEWTLHCPAHKDARPSLNLTAGRDDAPVFVCRAGCTQNDVIDALAQLGLWSRSGGTHRATPEISHRPRRPEAPSKAQRRLLRKAVARSYAVSTVAGEVVAVHVRVDHPPDAQHPDGWVQTRWQRPDGQSGLGGTPVISLPLFRSERLAALPDWSNVVVVEGEQATEALWGLGIPTVGTCTGCGATPSDAVLDVLKPFRIVLWPDADSDTQKGHRHMMRIAEALKRIGATVAGTVRWDQYEAGDAADVVLDHTHDGQMDRDAARGAVLQLLATAAARREEDDGPWRRGTTVDDVLARRRVDAAQRSALDDVDKDGRSERPREAIQATTWKSQLSALRFRQTEELETPALAAIPDYPLDILPKPLRDVTEAEPGLPRALVVGAGLAALAAAIGPNVEVELRPGWRRRAQLWIANIAPRGAGKSPAQEAAFGPLRVHDAEVRPGYELAVREWLQKPAKGRGPRPQDPTILGGDTTLEALARRLDRSSGAATLALDELSQFLRGLGEYKKGGGGDRGRALALWSGDPWRIERVTDALDIYIARPTVVICGGLQPALHELLGGEADGMRPRWLPHLAGMPTAQFQGAGSGPSTSWGTLLLELIRLRDRGRLRSMTTAGMARFGEHQRRWKERAKDLQGETLSAALQKADQQALAVLLILAEADEPGSDDLVGPELVDRAARAVEFSLDSWRALPEHGGLALSRKDEILDAGVERLRDFLEQHGGQANRRELLRHGVAGARTSADLTELLRRYEAHYPGTVAEEVTGQPGPRPLVIRAPTRDVSPLRVLSYQSSGTTVSADNSQDSVLGDGSEDPELALVPAPWTSGVPRSVDNSLANVGSADNSLPDSSGSSRAGHGLSLEHEGEREDCPQTGFASAPGTANAGTPAGVLAALRGEGCTLTVSTDSRGQRELVITGDDIPLTLLRAAKRDRSALIALLAEPALLP
jgi:Protein of unknown function (DUF3987)